MRDFVGKKRPPKEYWTNSLKAGSASRKEHLRRRHISHGQNCGCCPPLRPLPIPLLPSPTKGADKEVFWVGAWTGVTPWVKASPPTPAAQQWWELTQESRHRPRLPSQPGPQSSDVAHSPAGLRWPTRAVGDTVAQKSYWATPIPHLGAQRR